MLSRRGALGLLAAILAAGCSPTSDEAPASDGLRSVGNPYPEAAEARLFVHSSYDENGKPVLSKPGGRTLSAEERQAFERTLRIEPAPEDFAACFIPHHFFAYFDAQGKKIGELEVCFCCEGVQASTDIAAPVGPDEILSADYDALKTLVLSMGEPTDIEC